MVRNITIAAVALSVLLYALAAQAAPGLCVRKPPVTSAAANPNTGPPVDPTASRGQWFYDLRTGNQDVRSCEFYDNVEDSGGGWASCFAIEGYITQIFYDAQQKITGFLMDVCITNDMPALTPWLKGGNSHGEQLDTKVQIGEQDEVRMLNVKWVAEFADNTIPGDFPATGPPYWPAVWPNDWAGSNESNIFAKQFNNDDLGYDQLAWYCWTPEQGDPQPSDGRYMVPTWDFGDIDPGQTVCRTVQFHLRSPVDDDHPLGSFIEAAVRNEWDILLNRTTSLKISEYFDHGNVADWCIPYPGQTEPPESSSNCSVFFDSDAELPPPPIIDDVLRDPTGPFGYVTIAVQTDPDPTLTYVIESSTNPYNYNESLMTWTAEFTFPGGLGMYYWMDPNTPNTVGGEKYYRVYVAGPCPIYSPDTVGAMVTWCGQGRNLVSCMFEPYPDGGLAWGGTMGSCSLDKMLGDQFTGSAINFFSDTAEAWNGMTYDRAWYDTMNWLDWNTGGPPIFTWDADVGYWITILSFNPPTTFLQCGRVSKMPRMMICNVGRNLLGTCFPVPRTIDKMGLISSGFTGSSVMFFSDNVELWNTATTNYDRAWYDTANAQWADWLGWPWTRVIVPGDGFWVNVLSFNPAIFWMYPLPPGYN